VLQLVKAGDIEFCFSASANAATLSPQAGVFSLHFLFRDEDHLKKSVADPAVVKEVKAMIDDTVQGAHVLALLTLGFRNIYAKKEVKKLDDIKGMKVRVQATPTEDTMFPAYGAQIVHMPFGNVYTSLQTGVVDAAENGVNVYLVNKHYEVAPIMSMTQHEANNNLLWISDKLWSSLTPEQKGWVVAAADEVGKLEPGKALDLETQSATKLKGMGVKIVDGVDKSGFIKIAAPYLEKMAKDLGPHAAKIQQTVSAIK
jgi:TRAP-type transport system periplasmic protein